MTSIKLSLNDSEARRLLSIINAEQLRLIAEIGDIKVTDVLSDEYQYSLVNDFIKTKELYNYINGKYNPE